MKFLGFSIWLIVIWGNILPSFSQSNTTTSGGEATGTGGNLSYSIGQIDYINVTSGTGTITQGVQQPYEIYTIGVEKINGQITAIIYPNPAPEQIILEISDKFLDLKYVLFDIHGQQIISKKITDSQTYIPVVDLASGTYTLTVQNNLHPIKTFKIIKN